MLVEILTTKMVPWAIATAALGVEPAKVSWRLTVLASPPPCSLQNTRQKTAATMKYGPVTEIPEHFATI